MLTQHVEYIIDSVYDTLLFLLGSFLGVLINIIFSILFRRLGIKDTSNVYPLVTCIQVFLNALMGHYIDMANFFSLGMNMTQNVLFVEWLRKATNRGLKTESII